MIITFLWWNIEWIKYKNRTFQRKIFLQRNLVLILKKINKEACLNNTNFLGYAGLICCVKWTRRVDLAKSVGF